MDATPFTLTPGTRLLHIGPHKTGTTSLQGAFHRLRAELAAHDVVYAGKGRQAKEPAVALTRACRPAPGAPGASSPWDALCAETAAAGDRRVVISSEFFSNADADAARTAVRDLGGSPAVHVVVTLRPLLRILPSHWQQYVKHGLCHSYEDWLDGVLRRPMEDCPTPEFWHRHRHDALLERWADAAGLENVTVVVVDDAEPRRLFRAFENLLGLPEGILVPDGGGLNKSLTLCQAELLLQLNRRLADPAWAGWPRKAIVREAVVPHMQAYTPCPGEPRITTPAWAEEAAAGMAEEIVAGISALGVRVIGDLATLTPEPCGAADPVTPTSIPTAAAVEAILGGITAGSTLTRTRPAKPRPGTVEDRPVSKVPAADLLRIVGRRGLRRLRRELPGGRR
ncbi:hypothetical protein [Streptomyces specialis]|uniref:hypothetical protein n=1 Tax=Streptomyces specialis TaxID=498367 RepID=UPI00073F04B9|nr:hypothetical protein [Streptomyces specialis]